jgi:hypothetical protein
VGAENEEVGRHENATDVDDANLAYPTIAWVCAGLWAGLWSRLESAYG